MNEEPELDGFLKTLGFPKIRLHTPKNHFDFTVPSRRILVVGPMGSGKTEYSAGLWRDGQILTRKTGLEHQVTTAGADRRRIFFVRSLLDMERFPHYPEDALAYRGGYERCGSSMASIRDSFDLEKVIQDNPEYGTWIIDEASFYDERLAYLASRESNSRGLLFIFPTLVLNFRREIFNGTARLLLECVTDVFTLTAYCEHPSCLQDSHYTYRYYTIKDKECPAVYFDPLILIGGDGTERTQGEPEYCTRCDEHHWLPGKKYSFFTLKPLGEQASRGQTEPLIQELEFLNEHPERSQLALSLREDPDIQNTDAGEMCLNSLTIPCLAERALLFLCLEQNVIGQELFTNLAKELKLDTSFIGARLKDAGRDYF